MAAGLGFKTFTTGEVLTAADTNGYLMQGVLVFASAAARNAAITSPQEGQFAYTKDTNGLWYYDGAAWVASGATGDIEGVTAGVGISGGGTSGTVTITNDMATTITAAGDIVVGTGSGTYDNLPIGTTAQVLTADTTVSPYKVKWATPAGGSTFSGALVYRNNATGLSIPNNTGVAGVWEVEAFDVDGYWTSGAPTRLTIPSGKSGKFIITGRCEYSANGTGYRGAGIAKNGGAVNYGGPTVPAVSSSGIGTAVHNAVIVSADAGDYFEIFYGQNSGSTLTNQPGGGIYYDQFSIAYLGA